MEQMSIFDFLEDPQVTTKLSVEEMVKQYLFETHRVCCRCAWFEDMKHAVARGRNLFEEVKHIFSDGSEWSNMIMPYKDNDYSLLRSSLETARVGVVYTKSGITINYGGTYREKGKWKRIKMNYAEVADYITTML